MARNVSLRTKEQLQWLTLANDQLDSDEGFPLLKVLYLCDLGRGNLDALEGPRELVKESEKFSWEQSLALFDHRLRVLVPSQTTRSRRTKDLGAQNCLRDKRDLGIVLPPMTVELSRESKILECLVKSYVKLTEEEREKLKIGLLQNTSHKNNATIFDAFARFFNEKTSHDRCQGIITTFVTSLDRAKCPRHIYTDLQENLTTCGIRDVYPIPIPAVDPPKDRDEDFHHNVRTVLGEERHDAEKKQTRKMVKFCTCLCCPITLGIIILVVVMPIFSVFLNGQFRLTYEDSGFSQMSCPNMHPHVKSSKAAMLLGKLNSFWVDHITITQNGTVPYSIMSLNVYLIRSNELKVQHLQYSCDDSNKGIDFIIYLLKGSKLNFTTCVNSTSSVFPGVLNLTVCTTDLCFQRPYAEKHLEQVSLHVKPNSVNCTQNVFNFTAPHDQFYYITTDSNSRIANATLGSYMVDLSVYYYNSSKFKDPVCTSTSSQPRDCHVWLQRKSIFYPEEYALIAITDTTKIGQLQVEAFHRQLVYVIPGTAAGFIIVFGSSLVCLCFVVSYCRRRNNRMQPV